MPEMNAPQNVTQSVYDKLTSTKVWLSLVVYLVSCLLVWFGKISPDVWGALAQFTIVGYLMADVAHDWVRRKFPVDGVPASGTP